ncbi:MAG TPA: Hsp70 family protein [Actinoplanes sp.]|nr:Hsp70 family protein [Actinoplanes sp.]
MSIDQGGPKRHALGVDFGTSNTVAVARWPDGRARPILVDGSPLLPSAVYAEPDGQLTVGRDAVHSARIDPARFEPNPKRRIDDGEVLLGDREIPVVHLVAAVLARVAEEWRRVVGAARDDHEVGDTIRPRQVRQLHDRPELGADITLTCPATWGATRRTLLAGAATRAGLENARLVAEPVAAATYFAEVLGRDVPIGSVVVVHDFGAGTFDVSVVARTADGFEVLAVDGRDDIGGLDVDAAIVNHVGTLFGDRPEWRRLLEPSTVEERRAKRQLWDDVRIAKERLSRTQSADFVVPLLDTEVHLTRDELEKLARPVLDQTVEVTRGMIRWAGLPEGRLAGVFLVGGASRIPLVATLLHRELGEAPVAIEQPELVVAEGSILADAALLASGPAAPGPTAELRLASALRREPGTVRVSKPSRTPTADDADTVATPSRISADPRPAVDPWPHAAPPSWTPDPAATVIGDPPVSPPAPSPPARARAPLSDTRPMSPVPHPASPARTHPDYRRPTGPPTRRWEPSPPARRPARKKQRNRRRRGRFVRFLQILFSIVVLTAVPLAAMLLAYGYGNGDPIQEDARHVIEDIAKLVGL